MSENGWLVRISFESGVIVLDVCDSLADLMGTIGQITESHTAEGAIQKIEVV